MTPIRWLVLQIVLVIAIAAGAVVWASALMGSFDTYRSPFHGRNVAPGEAIGSPLTRRLVFVYVDGLRVDTAANGQVMPYLNELRAQGAIATSHSREPSYSIPGYTTMMSGAWPEFNDGPLLNPDDAHMVTWPQDNIFRAAQRAGLKVGLADHYGAEKLIPQEALADHFYVHDERNEDDRAATEAAVRWLKDGSYQFIVLHLDQVDDTGHKFGPRSPKWNEAASNVDGLLRELGGALDLTKDTLFITSDHGHIDQGGHGGHEQIVTSEPWILTGAGVKPGKYADTQMVDIAPTIAALLGSSIPALNQGHVRTDMLDLNQAQGTRIAEAVRKQQLDWVYAYLQATGRREVQLGATDDPVDNAQGGVERARASQFAWEGLGRAALVAILVLAVIAALWLVHEPVHHWHLLGALVYLVIFHVAYAVIEGRTYSLTSVQSAADILGASLITAVVAFAIATGFVLWRTGLRPSAVAAAASALEFALVVLTIVAVPALVGYAVNGAAIGWRLPNFQLMFFTFLSLLQLTGIGIAAIMASGIAALLGWRSAKA